MNSRALGRQLKTFRVARGLNQQQLANAVGVSRGWVSAVERGSGISLDLLTRMLTTLGFSNPREAAERLTTQQPIQLEQLAEAEAAAGEDSRDLRIAADSLRSLLREHEIHRQVVAFNSVVLSAAKAVLFDLEDLAERQHSGEVVEASRIGALLELATRLRNALALVRTAARLGESAAILTLADASQMLGLNEDQREQAGPSGDHQTG